MPIYSKYMTFGGWVLSPLLNDVSERIILSMTSFGRGHIFNVNEVSDVTFMFWCNCTNMTSVQIKKYMTLKNDLVFAKTRLRLRKTGQNCVWRALMWATNN